MLVAMSEIFHSLGMGVVRQSLFMTVCALAAWLHLACGLSRASTSRLLNMLQFIVQVAMELGALIALLGPGESGSNTLPQSGNPLRLPRDIRSAMTALAIEPDIVRSICCPKCFSKYNLDSLPQVCVWRETPRSRACGEKLWTTRSTRGGPRRVPRRLYATQNLESWLDFFLSRPGIEDAIDKSYAHVRSPHNMRSIWDSPAWQSLEGHFSSTPGNLTFSYYIDWFNPFTNKISGKTVSCGAIMMFCLNLPPDMQYLPENTFFAGITPPPKEPDVITITAVTDPIIDQLRPMWEGRIVKTHRHPQGIRKRVAVLARIGDLLAMRKALGFAGVASHHFCSFCKLLHEDKGDLDYLSWEPRSGSETLSAANKWKNATTKKEREAIFKEHGVRWSALHRLPYGDSVQHTLLGIMHNWMLGILQHHVRVRWGVGIPPTKADDEDTGNLVDQTPIQTARVVHDGPPYSGPLGEVLFELNLGRDVLDDEMESLYQESQSQLHSDVPSHLSRQRSEASMLLANDELEESDADDVDYDPESDQDSGDSDNSEEEAWKATCIFTAPELNAIRACLSDAVIPSWVERPPTNLGEKSHGKLKASEWFILFSIFLPLVLPEMWAKQSASRKHVALLDNFYNLVTCTHIVCAYLVKPDDPTSYLEHYIRYQKSSQTLFPNSGTRPNHHYAMHNTDLMRFWGPLMPLSEFAGERHNGSLQKIKTNNHLCALIQKLKRTYVDRPLI